MIKDLTAMEMAEMARQSNDWHAFQTACRLELERREYFNQQQPATFENKVQGKKEIAVGYYYAAAVILIGLVVGAAWGIVKIISLIGGLF